jgi:2-haloacid dehalogenase
MIDLRRFKLLTFDCYGTLIDWEAGIIGIVRPWLGTLGASVPGDLILSSFAIHQAKHQQYRPARLYPDVLARTWHDIEGTFGWPVDKDRAERFASSVMHWPPFEDTVSALAYLARHYKLGILSNVDNKSLAGTMALLRAPFAFTVTAEDVGAYKPSRPHFEEALRRASRIGVASDEILHVAQSKHHDIRPARALGLASVWVNRRHDKPGSGATLATAAEPDLTLNSLADLVALHQTQTGTPAPKAS